MSTSQDEEAVVTEINLDTAISDLQRGMDHYSRNRRVWS